MLMDLDTIERDHEDSDVEVVEVDLENEQISALEEIQRLRMKNKMQKEMLENIEK